MFGNLGIIFLGGRFAGVGLGVSHGGCQIDACEWAAAALLAVKAAAAARNASAAKARIAALPVANELKPPPRPPKRRLFHR